MENKGQKVRCREPFRGSWRGIILHFRPFFRPKQSGDERSNGIGRYRPKTDSIGVKCNEVTGRIRNTSDLERLSVASRQVVRPRLRRSILISERVGPTDSAVASERASEARGGISRHAQNGEISCREKNTQEGEGRSRAMRVGE